MGGSAHVWAVLLESSDEGWRKARRAHLSALPMTSETGTAPLLPTGRDACKEQGKRNRVDV